MIIKVLFYHMALLFNNQNLQNCCDYIVLYQAERDQLLVLSHLSLLNISTLLSIFWNIQSGIFLEDKY